MASEEEDDLLRQIYAELRIGGGVGVWQEYLIEILSMHWEGSESQSICDL